MNKFIPFTIGIVAIILMASSFTGKEPSSKQELGELLFFDPILSDNRTISCASCHKPAFAFADTSRVSLGVRKKKGSRNTPSAMNLSLQPVFFWDGRAKTLEEQALAPIENPVEMNLHVEEAVDRLRKSEKYNRWFKAIFNSEPTRANLGEAIAAFERTLETSDSPFDNWKFSDDPAAVSDAAKRGFILFNEKGKCVKCHFGADFTTHEFRNIGLFNGKNLNDSGRAVISGKKEDIGKFKTPVLRNVALTSPYMHNGMFRTLKQVIDFYNDPAKIVPNSIDRDTILAKPLGLTIQEKKDLEAFLRSLTDKRFNAAMGPQRNAEKHR
jgi:cytochrome c peroxidase